MNIDIKLAKYEVDIERIHNSLLGKVVDILTPNGCLFHDLPTNNTYDYWDRSLGRIHFTSNKGTDNEMKWIFAPSDSAPMREYIIQLKIDHVINEK